MPKLRDKAPSPLSTLRKPAYPRVLEVGALMLLGACSRGSDSTPHDAQPPPRPGGAIAAPMIDAGPLPPPSVSTGNLSSRSVEAGAPEVGPADAGKDAGKKATSGVSTRPPRTAGIPPHGFDEKNGL